MIKAFSSISRNKQELLFQLVLHILLYISASYDKDEILFDEQNVFYFLTYTAAAFVINYILLPSFFYKKKYFLFFYCTALVITLLILLEELVLEQIFYPDTKGLGFPGVFHTLLEVLPLISILSGFKFAWDAISKQKEVDSLKEAMRESELQFLSSQINPHFLFNNLNNLYAYAIEASPKTPDIILELSSVLRYMLYECRSNFVPLKKEIEHLKNFSYLNQLQIEERGIVNFHTAEIPSNFVIAPLILIVFVENAFKHSQSSQTDNIQIDISIEISPSGELAFHCRNNFHLISNTDKLSKGIGLENVRKRLKLLYPDQHKLLIEESDKEYDVYLSINLHQVELV
ncbi:MAG: histidine kinase [Bacteroidota bacterium]